MVVAHYGRFTVLALPAGVAYTVFARLDHRSLAVDAAVLLLTLWPRLTLIADALFGLQVVNLSVRWVAVRLDHGLLIDGLASCACPARGAFTPFFDVIALGVFRGAVHLDHRGNVHCRAVWTSPALATLANSAEK